MPIDHPTLTEWISAIASSISAIGVLIGLCIASFQLTSWRVQEKSKRKAEVAEKIMLSAFAIEDIMETARHPFYSIPQSEINNRRYGYEMREKILRDNSSIFNELRLVQFKARLLGFEKRIEDAIEQVFSVRSDFLNAIWELSDLTDQVQKSDEERNLEVEKRRMVFSRGTNGDEFGNRLKNTIAVLETLLGPIIRLNDRSM